MLIEEFEALQPQSAREFCKLHGLKHAMFSKWRQTLPAIRAAPPNSRNVHQRSKFHPEKKTHFAVGSPRIDEWQAGRCVRLARLHFGQCSIIVSRPELVAGAVEQRVASISRDYPAA